MMTLNLILAAAAVCGLLLGGLKLQTARLRRARARADAVAAVGRMDDAAVRQGLADDYRD